MKKTFTTPFLLLNKQQIPTSIACKCVKTLIIPFFLICFWGHFGPVFGQTIPQMKYDFIVQPHADPTQVRLKMDGVTNLKVNAQGELEFTTPFGTLQKGKPYTYQTVNGKQVEVATASVLKDGAMSFQLGDYDHIFPLSIIKN